MTFAFSTLILLLNSAAVQKFQSQSVKAITVRTISSTGPMEVCPRRGLSYDAETVSPHDLGLPTPPDTPLLIARSRSALAALSTINEELVSVPSTPIFTSTTRALPKSKLSPLDLLNSISDASKLTEYENTTNNESMGQEPPRIKTANDQHPGWLFRELHSAPGMETDASAFSISLDFSTLGRQHKTRGHILNQTSREHQRRIKLQVTETAPQERHIKEPVLRTTSSSHFMRAIDCPAHLQQWTTTNTEIAGATTSKGESLAKDLPVMQLAREESTKTFVFSEELAHIFPFDTLVQLKQDQERCISTTTSKPHRRCSFDAKSVISAADFAMRIKQIVQQPSDMSLLDEIESFSKMILCTKGQHQQRAARKLKTLRQHMVSITCSRASCESRAGAPSVALVALPYWLKALSSDEAISRTESLTVGGQVAIQVEGDSIEKDPANGQVSMVSLTNSTGKSTVSSRTRSSAVLKVLTESSTFVQRVPSTVPLARGTPYFQQWRPNSDLTVPQLIRQVLEQPLGKGTGYQNPGYVYIYWNPGKFGYVKIGHTTRTTEERLSEWNRGNCGHDAEEYKDITLPCQRVPHVHRVERLVLAELRDFRLKELNCPCGAKEHQEWFDILVSHAVKVRRKWEDFMLQREHYEPKAGGEFLQNTVSKDELDKLCQPLEIEKPPPPPKAERLSRQHGLRRSERLRKISGGRV